MTRLVAVEVPPAPVVPMCGRCGCGAPGVVTTVLHGQWRTWELYHCEEHPDGPGLALQLGFAVVAAVAA